MAVLYSTIQQLLLFPVLLISFTGPSLAANIDGGFSEFGALIGERIVIGCLGNSPDWKNDEGSVLVDGINGFEIDKFPSFNSLTITEFTEDFSGNYTCNDSVSSDIVTIFHQDYSLTIDGSLPHIEDDPVNLTCNFNTSPDKAITGYEWVAIDGTGTSRDLANTKDLFINAVPGNDSGGVYQCHVTVTNVLQPFTTAVNISFLVKPVVIGPSYITKTLLINESSQTTFELPCTINGEGIQYTWTIGDDPVVDGANYQVNQSTGSLSATGSILYSDAGVYTCRGSNRAGIVSVVYSVVVEGSPNITSRGSNIVGIYTGMTLSLPCMYQSNPDPDDVALLFRPFNSDDIVTVDTSRYTQNESEFVIESLIDADNGTFYCSVNNSYGLDVIAYTVTVYGVPDAPLLSVSVGSEFVNVSLSTPNVQDTVVDFYRVKLIGVNNDDHDREFVIPYEPEVTLLVIDGLLPNTPYQVAATAQNRAGISDDSERNTFVTDKSAPKFRFFNITRLDGGRSLRFDWLLLHDGGSPVITFTIAISPMTTPTNAIPFEISVSAGNHVIEDLEPNTEYNVMTSLVNEVDTLVQSYTVITARGPPLTPSRPNATDPRLTSATLSFTIPSIGSENVDYYIINVQSNDAIEETRLNSTHSRVISIDTVSNGVGVAQTVVLLMDSLSSDTSYSFNVSVGGAAGRSPFSEYSETIRTGNAMVLYYIAGGVLVGSLLLVLVVIVVIAIMVIITRRKKKRIGQKHTITDRIHEPTNFGFPNSSMSENVHIVEEYSPPSSSMEDHKEEIVSPPPYPGGSYVKVNHHRTLSVSSTTSSQMMCRKPDYLRSPSDHPPPLPLHVVDNCNDSAYGGSADKGVNHIYHQIPPRGMPASDNKLTSYSFPSINRVTSYDVDQLPPRLNCATDV